MNKSMRVTGVACALFLAVVSSTYAESDKNELKKNQDEGTRLEVVAEQSGKILVRGAKVSSISGNTIKAVTSYGVLNVEWIVETNGLTEFIRRAGGKSNISEISVGDYISFRGMLSQTASKPTVQASQVKDWSVQKRRATFTGSVTSVSTSTLSFTMTTKEHGATKVETTNQTKFQKENQSVTFADLHVGDKVQVEGLWNNAQNVLIQAERVKIYPNKDFREGNSQGILKSLPGTTVPTSFILTIGSTDYTVNVMSDTSILNTLWGRAALSQFKVGDKVRVYGVVSGTTIDATVVRDISI